MPMLVGSACLTLCKPAGGAHAPQRRILFLARRNQFRQPCVSSRIMPKVRRTMRSEKSLFNALLTHFLMGVALGLSLVLLLSLIDAFHVRDLIAKSDAPVQTTVMLVTTYALMFGIGATLTGLVLTLEDES